MLFNWANEQGLAGVKVYDLTIKDSRICDPLAQLIYFWCKVACTKEKSDLYYQAVKSGIAKQIEGAFFEENPVS